MEKDKDIAKSDENSASKNNPEKDSSLDPTERDLVTDIPLEESEQLDDDIKCEDVIPEEAIEIIRKIDETTDPIEKYFLLRQYSISYKGPLPLPSILEGYNKAYKKSAKKIIKVFEKQALHNIDSQNELQRLQRTALDYSKDDNDKSHRLAIAIFIGAIIVSLSIIGGGLYLVTIGQSVGGYTILAGGIVSTYFSAITTIRKTQKPYNNNEYLPFYLLGRDGEDEGDNEDSVEEEKIKKE